MNQKILQWAQIDRKNWLGPFREKDLQLIFKECC